MADNPHPTPDPSQVPVAKIEHDNTQLEAFLEQNRHRLLLGAVLVLIAVVGYLGFQYLQRSTSAEAAGAFTAAETIEELRAVIDQYPDNVVAGSAELVIAGKLQDEGKEDESHAILKSFVDTREGHPLYYKGVSDLGLKEHLKGDLETAVTHLRRAATAEDAPGYVTQIALLRLGDALTAQGLAAMKENDVETAKKLFTEADEAYADLESRGNENSALVRTAKDRKERLPHLSVAPSAPGSAAPATTPEQTGAPELSLPEPADLDMELQLPEAGDADESEDSPPTLDLTLPDDPSASGDGDN